jgi:hypothetical protein
VTRYRGRSVRGRSSVGRAPALQAGGRRFESARLHRKVPGRCPDRLDPFRSRSGSGWTPARPCRWRVAIGRSSERPSAARRSLSCAFSRMIQASGGMDRAIRSFGRPGATCSTSKATTSSRASSSGQPTSGLTVRPAIETNLDALQQHVDEHRSERPVLLAIDQELAICPSPRAVTGTELAWGSPHPELGHLPRARIVPRTELDGCAFWHRPCGYGCES